MDANIVARAGAIAQPPAGPNNYYALEYYKQLVPNAEVTLPGSMCADLRSEGDRSRQYLDAAEPGEAGRKLGGAIVATHSQSGIMGIIWPAS